MWHLEMMSYHRFKTRNITVCTKCGSKTKYRNRKIPIQKLKNIFKEKGCILLSNNYKNIDSSVSFIAKCGHRDSITLSYFIKGKSTLLCKKCSKKNVVEKVLKPYDEVVSLFEKYNAKLLTTKSEYKGVKQSVKYQCSCGNISHTSVYHWEHGHTRCIKCKTPTGSNHPMWNPNKTDDMRKAKRQYPEYILWRKNVFIRDKYTCQCCGQYRGYIQAHHILNYSDHIKEQLDINNGITLCKKCHDLFHSIYKRKNNNKKQLIEFINLHKARNDYQEVSLNG